MMTNFVENFSLAEMKAALADKPEFRFTQTPEGETIVCYMIAKNDTFDHPISLEGRGIVFGPDGTIVGRPLHKFFNVGERSETNYDQFDWSNIARGMEKRDGSMIHTFRRGDTWVFKSKKSLTSNVAVAATAWARANADLSTWLLEQTLLDRTAIFEWTSPQARIVIKYPKPQLTLLHVRENKTGRYLSHAELEDLKCPVPIVLDDMTIWSCTRCPDPIDTIKDHVKTLEGKEGWVIQFDENRFVKLKTDWYMARHHIVTTLRDRDAALMVLEEKIDDVKSIWRETNFDLTPIFEIEKKVVQNLTAVIQEAEEMVSMSRAANHSKKEFAMAHKHKPCFALACYIFDGKDPDYKAWYIKHRLKQDFSLNYVKEDAQEA